MGRGKAPGLHVDCDCCSHVPPEPWEPPPPVYGPETLNEFMRRRVFNEMLKVSVYVDRAFDPQEFNFKIAFELFEKLDAIATLVREEQA